MADTILHVSAEVLACLCAIAVRIGVSLDVTTAAAINHYWTTRTQEQRVEAAKWYLDRGGGSTLHSLPIRPLPLPPNVTSFAKKAGPGPSRIQHEQAALWVFSQMLEEQQMQIVREFVASEAAKGLLPRST